MMSSSGEGSDMTKRPPGRGRTAVGDRRVWDGTWSRRYRADRPVGGEMSHPVTVVNVDPLAADGLALTHGLALARLAAYLGALRVAEGLQLSWTMTVVAIIAVF